MSSAGAMARALVRRGRSATLATAEADGWPYASLVTVACDGDASPILLLSDLSDHTRNLGRDPRASLLFEEGSRRSNPQTGPRVTLLGRIERAEGPELRRRFLARHPGAQLYAGFADFHVYRMTVDRAHLVGGFARSVWLKAGDVTTETGAAAALSAAEGDILAHMNADHADAIDLYAARLLGRKGQGWRLIGIDPDGCDLGRDGSFARLPFPRPATDPDGLRNMLIELAAAARSRTK